MGKEFALGHHPRDVSAKNLGNDNESTDGQTGRLRLLEVKGRIASARTITVTRNEILAALTTSSLVSRSTPSAAALTRSPRTALMCA